MRFPSDPIAAELILQAGGYVAAPSANTSGRPSPTTAQHVEEDLGAALWPDYVDRFACDWHRLSTTDPNESSYAIISAN